MQIHIRHESSDNIFRVLRENRNIEPDDPVFFHPEIGHLHDPFLIPDMEQAVERILKARENKERVVIFGDYDVDGVSGTAILVRFLTELGMPVSYRLPHRVHDGYGLKKYFFDELKEKDVQLVITVDCGTRDIEVIEYAKSLGIDVIVTDHHAVPERIPEGVPVLNPKRHDSKYPFPNLAGAGVAFKLLHAIIEEMKNIGLRHRDEGSDPETQKRIPPNDWIASCLAMTENRYQESILRNYIDFTSLGTVADCMPLTGENRTITTLGLKQMKNSHSHGLRKFLDGNDKVDGNADIIGFQLGPRINAAGRMNTPLTALRWLLASEDRCDEFLEEIEELNTRRQQVVKNFAEKALTEADPEEPILFFVDEKLEHGLIGLVAGRLTEAYNRPSIVLCQGEVKSAKGEDVKKREYENIENQEPRTKNQEPPTLVASCRSPEWCNLVELLDECKDFFVRYGGHRQAAGFTIEATKLTAFQEKIQAIFREKYDTSKLPEKTLNVECVLNPKKATLETLGIINRFRPFGIGNPKPLWLLENVTIASVKYLGSEQKHLSLNIAENLNLRLLYWNSAEKKNLLEVGNIISLVIELEENEWNGRKSVQGIVREVIAN